MSVTSADVREKLVEALRLDLIGPDSTHAFARELLPDVPSRWYLTGFLVPSTAPLEQRFDESSREEIDSANDARGLDDANEPEKASAKRSFLPSSMGLSVLMEPGQQQLRARVSWGDYVWEGPGETIDGDEVREEEEDYGDSSHKQLRGYRRIPREQTVRMTLPSVGEPVFSDVPGSDGLKLLVTVRPVSSGVGMLPADTLSVSVFLVNERVSQEPAYRSMVFQTKLELSSAAGFVARPDMRGQAAGLDDWDERVADLQYRDVCEFAVGHGCSASWRRNSAGACMTVNTSWVPSAEVERVAPSLIRAAEFQMETLAALADAADAKAKLEPLVDAYSAWIVAQGASAASLAGKRKTTADELMTQAKFAAKRLREGIELLADPDVFYAFTLANKVMARSARQRVSILTGVAPEDLDPPAWRPFQLAFILMTLRGVVDPTHADRQRVDLLFFPTGGGKTEAYLGLAAFTLVLRRLKHDGPRAGGMSVLMRYTLRLLTLDQLGRAAGLICALELEREQTSRLGTWPFEIGLWVGSGATPNRMGHRGYTGPGKDETAYIRTQRYNRDSKRFPAPIPIENCPWCGTQFEGAGKCFRLHPSERNPLDLHVRCANYKCEFSRKRPLPIIAVDEPIYRRLPAFLIATVDKFAALPWIGRTGALFGKVDRHNENGFYGPCDPGMGEYLGGHLPPPDLIIQDELHLISGPLGTIAGIYETAIDALARREDGDQVIHPKIVASTATVRRADSQIRALFNRSEVSVFPPPGPDRRDSFFAETLTPTESPARMYIGIAAQGRSLKVVLLRTSLALLGAGQKLYEANGGKRSGNPVDPYMTIMGYFNSLRELGGSRRIIEDEVLTRLEKYSKRRRLDPVDELFADRKINYEVVELTSRVPTDKVATAKRLLTLGFDEEERVDVALATNMISVGLDIVRLGLMTVLGQPKTSSEYIQATSRVGRDAKKPGLVVTLLNIHKPRDRSHYERFMMFHETFYRAVEPTSVTPFSPRALDRALSAALVGLCRQDVAQMTPPRGAEEIKALRANLTAMAKVFAVRAKEHRNWATAADGDDLEAKVLARCNKLLDDWLTIAKNFEENNSPFQYQREEGGAQRLLYEPLHPELASLVPVMRQNFRANRSMRDVETNVEIEVKNLDDWGN